MTSDSYTPKKPGLPVDYPTERIKNRRKTSILEETGEQMQNGLKRVLIVDDEEDLTWTLSKKLSKDSDKFEVLCVNSGNEAVDVLNQLPVDLVITDVRMPEVSGLDLLLEIRDQYPLTKVIIMTAYGTRDVQQEAADRGCFNYIEKPFEINELRQHILNAITHKRGFKGSVSDFQLSDIIQLNCLGRLTSALKVTCDDQLGMIYFQEGNIVHAEAGHLEGESAFYHIMRWQGGEFTVVRNQTALRETIQRGWQSLLLESMRRVDEASDLAKVEAKHARVVRQNKLRAQLNPIMKSQGVEHGFLHNKEGFILLYRGKLAKQTDAISSLGNQMADCVKDLEKTLTFLNGGAPEFWEFQLEKGLLVSCKIPDEEAYLTVLGSKKARSKEIRNAIRSCIPGIKELL